MKRLFTKAAAAFAVIIALGFSNNVQAQLEAGSVIIEPYYGMTSGKTVFTALTSVVGTSTYSAMGPLGLRFQYSLSESFAVGVDGHYATQKTEWVGEVDEWNNVTGEYDTYSYDYSAKRDRIRIMFRTSWEFVNNEKFQLNWANSFGWRNATWTFESTQDGWSESIESVNPIAFRTAIGVRYLFTENLGLNGEFGFGGGSIANLGLTIKL